MGKVMTALRMSTFDSLVLSRKTDIESIDHDSARVTLLEVRGFASTAASQRNAGILA